MAEIERKKYDDWFRGKVEEALTSRAPLKSHDEVMSSVRKLMEE